MIDVLTGRDYPELCEQCRNEIDAAVYQVQLLAEINAVDTMGNRYNDNEEGPCDYVYDHRLFCRGYTCKNNKEALIYG